MLTELNAQTTPNEPSATPNAPGEATPPNPASVTPPTEGQGTPTPGSSSPGVGEPTQGGQNNTTNVLVDLGLAQEILGHDRIKGLNTVEDLANALIKADLAPAAVKPEDYQLPQGIPDAVRGIAHSLSLTQQQLEGVLQFQAENATAVETAQREAMVHLGQQKMAEWGDSAKSNLEKGKQAVNYLESKSPGIVELLNSTGYGNHPTVLEMFKTIGDMLKEGGFNPGENYTPAANKSAADRMFPTQANKTE